MMRFKIFEFILLEFFSRFWDRQIVLLLDFDRLPHNIWMNADWHDTFSESSRQITYNISLIWNYIEIFVIYVIKTLLTETQKSINEYRWSWREILRRSEIWNSWKEKNLVIWRYYWNSWESTNSSICLLQIRYMTRCGDDVDNFSWWLVKLGRMVDDIACLKWLEDGSCGILTFPKHVKEIYRLKYVSDNIRIVSLVRSRKGDPVRTILEEEMEEQADHVS